MAVVLGVMVGAGPALSSKRRIDLSHLCKSMFNISESAYPEDLVELVTEITAQLEDSPLTNAGIGSELTIEGSVECDASLVYVNNKGLRKQFAVGAVPDLRNPIRLCEALAQQPPDPYKAIPNFLVGPGARDFGIRKYNLKTESLVTAKSQRVRERYLDTVCVFAMGPTGTVATASSGGPILKEPGRIGPAAIPGCCTQVSSDGKVVAIASGFGEDITAFQLAHRACTSNSEEISSLSDLSKSMMSEIALQRPPYFGCIRAERNEGRVAVDWVTTAESMIGAVGILGTNPCLIDVTRPGSGGIVLDSG